MTVRALPVRKWPAALAAGADGLAREERLALGRLCHARALTAVPAIADVAAFLAQRAETLTPPVAERERKVLVSALRKAVPSTAWSQLRAAETDATGQPERRGKPRSVSLSPAEWPAPQRVAWEAARDPGFLQDGDVVAYGPGPLADLSQSTLAAREKAYGLYLGSRRSRGKPLTVTPVGVQVFIDDCRARGNRPRSIAKYVSDLYPIARTVHPDVDFDWLRRTCNSLRARAAEAPKKKWDEPPADPAALWAIGCDLIDRAHAGAADSRRNAALFRDGVLFLLLSSAPVRLENLAEIAIGTHLILSPEGPGYLTFEHTKAGHAAELPLWPELRAALEVYLDVYRPVLLGGQPTDALWIALQGGEPLRACGVADRIREHTESYLGRPLSPHRFRDAVATALVLEHPDAPDLASAMLQHRNPRSIAEYTEQGRTVGAARLLMNLSKRAYGEAQRAQRGG
jgi:integrase